MEAGETVAALVQLGAKDDRSAVKALEAVVGALEKQTQCVIKRHEMKSS